MSVQTASDEMRTLISSLTATGKWLDALTIRLTTTNVTISPATRLADLVEATFDGYAPSTVVAWGAPWSDASGNAYETGDTKQFTCTGPTVQDTITGWYATSGSGGGEKFMFGANFETPKAVGQAGDVVIVVPQYSLPGPTDALSE